MSEDSDGAVPVARIINVATPCATREDFIARFRPFLDEATVFIPGQVSAQVGERVRFAIALADGAGVLAGTGDVAELHQAATGPRKRPGVRVRLTDLTPETADVRERILRTRGLQGGPIPLAAAPDIWDEPTRSGEDDWDGRPTAADGHGDALPPEPAVEMVEADLGADEVAADPMKRTMIGMMSPVIKVPPLPRPTGAARPAAVDLPSGSRTPPPQVAAPPPQRTPPPQVAAPPPQRTPPPQVVPPAPPPHSSKSPAAPLTAPFAAAPAFASPPPPPARAPAAAVGPISISSASIVPSGAAADPTVGLAATPVLMSPYPALAHEAPSVPAAPALTRDEARANTLLPGAIAAPSTQAGASRRMVAVIAGVAALVGLLVGAIIGGRDQKAPPPGPRVVAPAAPAAGKPCLVGVTSNPPKATVEVDGRLLGVTPIAEAWVPCGKATLTVKRPRYQDATVELDGVPERPREVAVELERPPARLTLLSKPPGAAFTVNGEPVGVAPRETTVPRYERADIAATLDGYQPFSRKITVGSADYVVRATLRKATGKRRPPAARAAKKPATRRR